MKKETRGRKALSPAEKKKPITLFIKAKDHAKAKKIIAEIQRKLNTIENNKSDGKSWMAGSEEHPNKP